jgi:hypothetical protein
MIPVVSTDEEKVEKLDSPSAKIPELKLQK